MMSDGAPETTPAGYSAVPSSSDTFAHLMQQVREGSEDAAWELVSQFGESIRRAVRRVLNVKLRRQFDSVDFVQLVWGSLFRDPNHFDRFDRPEELTAYLVKMARNKVGMEIRRQLLTQKRNVGREQSLDRLKTEEGVELSSREPPPIDVAIARERWNRLLQGQPLHYRKIIHLRLQGHTFQGIADAVHLDECTVRRFVKRLLHTAVA